MKTEVTRAQWLALRVTLADLMDQHGRYSWRRMNVLTEQEVPDYNLAEGMVIAGYLGDKFRAVEQELKFFESEARAGGLDWDQLLREANLLQARWTREERERS